MQHGGKLSMRVGLLWVSNGFMYFVSKPPQIRASQAFSDELVRLLDADATPPSSALCYYDRDSTFSYFID